MWAHGKFLTDCQAQAIINKIDQKKDGKVRNHLVSQFPPIVIVSANRFLTIQSVIDYSEFLLVVARKILISNLEL